jgi:hypothetical protein
MSVLRPLYAVAIALLVVAFVGFGISAFYPEPEYPEYPLELEYSGPGEDLTKEEKKQIAEYREEEEAFQREISDYNRVVTSIAIGVAVLLLVGSLLWISGLPVIGEGTTLGAVFTLFYGLIRAFMTNDEQFRFVAVAIGLVVLLALVYWKFSRSPTLHSRQKPT